MIINNRYICLTRTLIALCSPFLKIRLLESQKRLFAFLVLSLVFIITSSAQVALQQAMINACGDEDNHEFISFLATDNLDKSLIDIRYGSDPTCSSTTIQIYNANTAQQNNQATIEMLNELAGCSAFEAADNTIPTGSLVYVLDVDFFPATYTGWSSFCNNPAVVLFVNLPNESGNFLNGIGTRFFCVSYNGGPNGIYGYTNTESTHNGAYAAWATPGLINITNPAVEDCDLSPHCDPPSFTNPGNQSACGSYTLPIITGTGLTGNEAYYSEPGGFGIAYTAGEEVGSGTYYIYDLSSSCSPEVSFEVVVTPYPQTTTVDVLQACATSGSEAVFDLTTLNEAISNGIGQLSWYQDAAANLPIIHPQQYLSGPGLVYAVVRDGDCSSEPMAVELGTYPSPRIDPIGDMQNCDFVELPSITGSNLQGTIGFFAEADAGGMVYLPGDLVSQTTNLYAYAGTPGCSDQQAFSITILSPPTAAGAGLSACAPAGGNGQAVFNLQEVAATVNNGTGLPVRWYANANLSQAIAVPTSYSAGSSSVYAVVDAGGNCQSPAATVVLQVTQVPRLDQQSDYSGCQPYTLPALTGTQLQGTIGYFTAPQAGGTAYQPGDVIGQTTALYAYAGSPGCSDEQPFYITINTPPAANGSALSACPGPQNQAIFNLQAIAAVVNNGTGLPVQWYEDAALSLPLSNPAAYVSVSDTVYAVVIASEGCESAPAAVSLQASSLPAGPVTLLSSLDSICTSTAVTLTVNLPDTPNPSYWLQLERSNAQDTTISTHTQLGIVNELIFTLAEATTFRVAGLVDERSGCTLDISQAAAVSIATGGSLQAMPASMSQCAFRPDTTVAIFGLNLLSNTIRNGQTGQVNYYLDADASLLIGQPNNFVSPSRRVYAVLQNGFCRSAPVPVDLTVETGPVIRLSISQPVSCAGAATAAILTEVEGTAPFVFDWNVDALDGVQNPTGLSAGNYGVTITTAGFCRGFATLAIPDAAPLQLSCEASGGNPLGTASLQYGGGVPPYGLAFSGPLEGGLSEMWTAGTALLEDLPPGSYTVTMNDGYDCTTSCSFEVPLPWAATPTSVGHTIHIADSLEVVLDGYDLQEGDLLGFFFLRDSQEICSNFIVWTGSADSCRVYSNEAAPGAAKNGFAPAELFRVKIYKMASGQVLNVRARYALPGSSPLAIHTDRFAAEGSSLLLGLSTARRDSLRIDLRAGWNMISSFVAPDEAGLLPLLEQLGQTAVLLRDDLGRVVVPSTATNQVGVWQATEGYQLKVAADTSLLLIGSRLDPAETPIELQPGWQMISYLRNQPGTLGGQLAAVAGRLELVKNNAGRVYMPAYGIDDIGAMLPGQGYRLKVSAAATLLYPPNLQQEEVSVLRPPAGLLPLTHFLLDTSYNTGNNSTLIFPAASLAAFVADGDELGLFNSAGQLCGAGRWTAGNLALTAWGDDATTDEADGLLEGEAYSLRLWRQQTAEELPLLLTFAQGDGLYGLDDIEIVAGVELVSTDAGPWPMAAQLHVFPNPAREAFFVQLPAKAQQLWVYDQAGRQLLSQPVVAEQLLSFSLTGWPAGSYQLVVSGEKGYLWYAQLSILPEK